MLWDKFTDFWQGRLYLRRLDFFEDEQEGRWPEGVEKLLFDPQAKNPQAQKDALEAQRKATFVSCWTMGHADQVRMWQTYIGDRAGVAVQVRYRDLQASLHGSGHDLALGGVRCTDRIDSEWVRRHPRSNTLVLAFQKRCSYEWEREVRVVLQIPEHDTEGDSRTVPIDLGILQPRLVVGQKTDEKQISWLRSAITTSPGTELVVSTLG